MGGTQSQKGRLPCDRVEDPAKEGERVDIILYIN
jgi:hypothetical protein